MVLRFGLGQFRTGKFEDLSLMVAITPFQFKSCQTINFSPQVLSVLGVLRVDLVPTFFIHKKLIQYIVYGTILTFLELKLNCSKMTILKTIHFTKHRILQLDNFFKYCNVRLKIKIVRESEKGRIGTVKWGNFKQKNVTFYQNF